MCLSMALFLMNRRTSPTLLFQGIKLQPGSTVARQSEGRAGVLGCGGQRAGVLGCGGQRAASHLLIAASLSAQHTLPPLS